MLHDGLAFFTIGLLDGVLDQCYRRLAIHHAAQMEERNLHYGIDTTPLPYFPGYFEGVYIVELKPFGGDGAAHGSRKLGIHLG